MVVKSPPPPFKAKAYLAKRLFDIVDVLNLRKIFNMERKSLKEYSVVFFVEGERFKLRNLPSRTSSLLSLQYSAAVPTPNIARASAF